MRRTNDEQGAIAVLLAILFSFALVVATAAGMSSLTRAGTRGELQRAADAGSLAGARSIPLTDVGTALAYVTAPDAVTFPGAEDPRSVACRQAAATAAVDDAVSEEYAAAVGPQNCTATYLSDLDGIDRLQACAQSLTASVPALPQLPPAPLPTVPSLPGLPGVQLTPLPQPTLTLPDPTELLHARLANLVPALLRPGIKVELSRTTSGALDGAVEGAVEDGERVASTARRRFKNLIVLPVADVLPALVGEPIDPNPALADTHDEVVTIIETVDARFEQSLATLGSLLGWDLECHQVFDALKDDFNDVYNPGSGDPPALSEVVADMRATGEQGVALVVGWANGAPVTYPNDPTGALNIPFFDFVPVCFSGGATLVGETACATRATGAFRASLVRGEMEDA